MMGAGMTEAACDLAPEADAEATLVITVARARRLRSTDLNGKADPFVRLWVCSPPDGAARAALVEALGEREAEMEAASRAKAAAEQATESTDSLSGDGTRVIASGGAGGASGAAKVPVSVSDTSLTSTGSDLLLGPPPPTAKVKEAVKMVTRSKLRAVMSGPKPWRRVKVGQTVVCEETLSPVWNARFEVELQVRDILLVEVWDYDRFSFNDFVGGCVVLPEWYLEPRTTSELTGMAEIRPGLGRIGWALTRRRADWYRLASKSRLAKAGDALLQARIGKLVTHRLPPDVVKRAGFQRPATVVRRKSLNSVAAKLSDIRGVHIEVSEDANVSVGGSGTPVRPPSTRALVGDDAADVMRTIREAQAGKLSSVAPQLATVGMAEAEGLDAAEASGGITVVLPPQRLSQSADAVHLVVQPHTHTKFCDRSFRVCTADGKFQEGEIVKAMLPHEVALPTGATTKWSRQRDSSTEWVACEPAASEVDLIGEAGSGSHDKGQALSSVAGALAFVSQAIWDCDASPDCRYLTRSDVGCLLRATVSLPDGKEVVSGPIGPVHPAHPFVRRVNVVGELVVGSVLRAEISYFGGAPGKCEFSWLQITKDGSRVTVSDGSESPAVDCSKPLPALDDMAAVTADPRTLVLKEEHAGSRFKVQCTAVRADGERGQPGGHTSKPVGPVAPIDGTSAVQS